ncbi:MAG: hypothetical protein Q7S28_01865 [bacterium]|nr:hypothetical protein [bacterium]
MKTILGIVLAVFMGLAGYATAEEGDSPETVTVSASTSDLDLKAIQEVAKRAKNAEEFEHLINEPDSGNNLDLDNDGNTDYLRVEEFGSGNIRGFAIYVDLPNGEAQEVARIEVERIQVRNREDRVRFSFWGNPYVYGYPMRYSWYWGWNSYPISIYFWSYHTWYVPSWHYGYYPSYYYPRPWSQGNHCWTPNGGRRDHGWRDRNSGNQGYAGRTHSREWRNSASSSSSNSQRGNEATSRLRQKPAREAGARLNQNSARTSEPRLRKKPASRGQVSSDRRPAQSPRVERKPDSSRGSRDSRNRYTSRPNAGSSPSVRPSSPRTNRGSSSARPPSSRPNAQRVQPAPRSAPSAPRNSAPRSSKPSGRSRR